MIELTYDRELWLMLTAAVLALSIDQTSNDQIGGVS